MSLNRLKTTTRSGRNVEKLEELKKHLIEQNINNIWSGFDFLIIWPWWLAKPFASILSSRNQNVLDRVKYLLIRQIEAIFRKSGIFELEIFEVDDFLEVFWDTNILWNLYVADIEDKVLDSIKNKYWEDRNIKTIKIDLSDKWFTMKFDVVVCYNVLQRINNLADGLDNINNSLNQWWVMSIEASDLNEKVNCLLEGRWFKKMWKNIYKFDS